MKKTVSLVNIMAILLAMMSLLSCKNNGHQKIGVLVPTSKIERFKLEARYITDKLSESGASAEVMFAEDDDKLQIAQAKELIEKGVDVLIVGSINQNTAAEIVRAAHRKNIKVIAYDRLISNCDLDYYISFDNEKVGTKMTDYVIKLKPKGNYIILNGDKRDKNAVFVHNGIINVLDNYVKSGQIKVLYDVYIESWSKDNARNEMQKFLKLSTEVPDVIITSYDGLSSGAIEALQEFGLDGKVLVTGQDAELEACRNIMKDKQIMTVYKPIKILAERAAELALIISMDKGSSGQTIGINNGYKDVPSVLIPPIVTDKANMKFTVVADGMIKAKDLE
jgi:D-xylose transport system substrate-binding protein